MSIEERFPVIDVTHKSKRTQRDNVLKAKGEREDCSPEKVDDEVPSVFTLERAIAFYEGISSSPNGGKFYAMTAEWLRELLSLRSPKNMEVKNDVVA